MAVAQVNLMLKAANDSHAMTALDSYATAPEPPAGPCKGLVETEFAGAPWFEAYARATRAVRAYPPCPSCTSDALGSQEQQVTCARFWHREPERSYVYRKGRQENWTCHWLTTQAKRQENWTTPAKDKSCPFEPLRPIENDWVNDCKDDFGLLFRQLDRLKVAYFPRSGTELAITRGGRVSDGDLDFFVDMPSRTLYNNLKTVFGNNSRLHRDGSGNKAEVHLSTQAGCPELHMVFNDWVASLDALENYPPPLEDLCRCKFGSVELWCHAQAPARMRVQYGPAWRLPLGVKQMDDPLWCVSRQSDPWCREVVSVLSPLKSKSAAGARGLIDRQAVLSLIEGDDWKVARESLAPDLDLAVAQVNLMLKAANDSHAMTALNSSLLLPALKELKELKEGAAQCSHHGGLVPVHAVGQQPPGSATGSVPRTCQCLKGYTGDSCQARANTTSDKWQIHAENAHKFDGYAKTVCPNKLSTSGRIPGMTPRRSWCTR